MNPAPPNNNNPDQLAKGALKGLRERYMLVGKTHVKTWHGLLILGVVVGIVAGILFVIDRDGNLETGKAATA